MPRYLVQRTFDEGVHILLADRGAERCRSVVGRNSKEGVTWLHSYVSNDKRTTFCVYDADSPEAIRRTARRNGLPVDRIIAVSVLDPYFYLDEGGNHE